MLMHQFQIQKTSWVMKLWNWVKSELTNHAIKWTCESEVKEVDFDAVKWKN